MSEQKEFIMTEQLINSLTAFIRDEGLAKDSNGHIRSTTSEHFPKVERLWYEYMVGIGGSGSNTSLSLGDFVDCLGTLAPIKCYREAPDRLPLKYDGGSNISDFVYMALRHSGIVFAGENDIRRYGHPTSFEIAVSCLKEVAREYEIESRIPGTKEHFRKVFDPSRMRDSLRMYASDLEINRKLYLARHPDVKK